MFERRMSISLGRGVEERLEKLMKTSRSGSKVEVIRKALAVYEILCDGREEGCKVLLSKPGGETAEVIIS